MVNPPPISGRYDPFDFNETGPDTEAVRLMRKGAPGGPQPIGTCVVGIKLGQDPAGKFAAIALTQKCRKYGKVHKTGKKSDAIMLAEVDAARMDGHQCRNETW
tara:strand:+ start:4722 stop:5030 length:309 start_codon:yes stop_codon:yes gene_type:complete